MVCESCWLVQLPAFETREAIFGDYLYFSSFSDSWLVHCAELARDLVQRLNLNPQSRVVEVASNDGYLLQYFQGAGIPVLGIEPAANVAKVAQAKGIPTEVRFMGTALGQELATGDRQADLLLGLNVLAHVPDLHDFAEGLVRTLAPQGTLVLEFPHLLELIRGLQFDTIYHEHFSYLSLLPVERLFKEHGLSLFDVERLSTHGGSLRLYACHRQDSRAGAPSEALRRLQAEEHSALLDRAEGYQGFATQVANLKHGLLSFLLEQKAQGREIAGYGAPAKGNTLLNYAGVRPDLVSFTVDRSPHKQGRFLPGSRIPILPVEALEQQRPEFVLILPWNLKGEIRAQMGDIARWGGRMVTAVPSLEFL
jgi:SAM-dependent methyltransferase